MLRILFLGLLFLTAAICGTRRLIARPGFWNHRYEAVHSCISKLLLQMQSVFVSVGVTYWLHAGSLLGAERNKGFIPWDDDADLAVMDDERFEKALRLFE